MWGPPCLSLGVVATLTTLPSSAQATGVQEAHLHRLPRQDMARRSLRPHLNQIRGWVRQGRTDAWIAHQLEVTVQQIEAFKRENDLVPDAEPSAAPHGGASAGADFDD